MHLDFVGGAFDFDGVGDFFVDKLPAGGIQGNSAEFEETADDG